MTDPPDSSPVRDAHDALRAMVGAVTEVEVGMIHQRELERFAFATGLAGQWGGPSASDEAPPMFLTAVMEWSTGPAQTELRADGSSPDVTGNLPLDGLKLMGAGQDVEWSKPVRAGMVIRGEFMVDDVQLKHGKQGDLLLIRIKRTFRDEAGHLVLTCIETVIAR